MTIRTGQLASIRREVAASSRDVQGMRAEITSIAEHTSRIEEEIEKVAVSCRANAAHTQNLNKKVSDSSQKQEYSTLFSIAITAAVGSFTVGTALGGSVDPDTAYMIMIAGAVILLVNIAWKLRDNHIRKKKRKGV